MSHTRGPVIRRGDVLHAAYRVTRSHNFQGVAVENWTSFCGVWQVFEGDDQPEQRVPNCWTCCQHMRTEEWPRPMALTTPSSKEKAE